MRRVLPKLLLIGAVWLQHVQIRVLIQCLPKNTEDFVEGLRTVGMQRDGGLAPRIATGHTMDVRIAVVIDRHMPLAMDLRLDLTYGLERIVFYALKILFDDTTLKYR